MRGEGRASFILNAVVEARVLLRDESVLGLIERSTAQTDLILARLCHMRRFVAAFEDVGQDHSAQGSSPDGD